MMLTHSESIAKLAAALVKVAGEIENPTKNARNPHFGNKYADLAELTSVSREVMAKHGLTVLQCPGMEGNHVTVASMILHESGEWIQGVASSPVPKADPQGVGSATTYLRRYSLAALLGLAQEDDDGEGAGQGSQRPAQPQQARPEPPKKNGKRTEPFSLFGEVTVGKHKGKTWADLIEKSPRYVEWALENMNTLTDEAKVELQGALNRKTAAVPLGQPDDDLPF